MNKLVRLNEASFSPGQEKAREVLSGPCRNICLYGGTRSGKTFLIVRAILHRALRGDSSRHAILRFRANAARASIALDTLPKVTRFCFPGLALTEHRQDGFYELPNKSQLWIGGLDDKERVEKILGQEYCVDPLSKILTAELNWVFAKDLKINDEIVGFDEELEGHIKLESSYITRHSIIMAPRVRIITTKGETIVSINHKFVTRYDDRRKKGASYLSWREASQLNVGSYIRFASKPWEVGKTTEDGWFAGMLDGEGWVSPAGTGVAQCKGVCLDALCSWLNKNEIAFTNYESTGIQGKKGVCHQLRTQGLWPALKMLGIARPKRLDGRVLWDGRRGFTGGNCEAEVLSIESIGVGPVVSMETTSRTFIADGFLGHNCTIYLNEASQISYAAVLVAQTRLAQQVPGLKQRFLVDLNPPGKSHWTNKLFVQKVDPQSGRPLPDPENYDVARVNPVDNAHNLSPEYLNSLANMPEKQRRRFYEGSYLEEVDGALWTYELLERTRVEPQDIPESKRKRVIIAVDPSGASSKDEEQNNDDIGIVVVCQGDDGHGYVLNDQSFLAGPGGPEGWAARAVALYKTYKADKIVAERNFGGEMVRTVLQAVDPYVPVKLVTASRGKHIRADPISTLFEKGMVHMAGRFSKLEEQLCAFTSAGYTAAGSPDNADAMIWGISELMLEEEAPTAQTGTYTTSR